MILDAWVNVFPKGFAASFGAQESTAGVHELFGDEVTDDRTLESLMGSMDGAGIDVGVLTCGLRPAESARRRGMLAPEDFLAMADAHAGRFLVAPTVEKAGRPLDNCRRIRELAEHPAVALVRITPLVEQYDLNHRLYYPVYATCEELGLPVSINIGVPGPQVRSACQHPQLLEDVLIDFPTLTVVGAHMGHPHEALLIGYMLKWPQLHLMTSAFLATYMDPAMVTFMGSSRGRGRVWFASDHPILDVQRALDAARALPLDAEAMAEFLGDAAHRVLTRP
ncbi:MAG: amidohydrolase 2 [Acidimicrobiales bacterium]|nr:amidohydrolase 2 [Acidimicrobiales bacterium]